MFLTLRTATILVNFFKFCLKVVYCGEGRFQLQSYTLRLRLLSFANLDQNVVEVYHNAFNS